jgi:hypothetical protein
MAGCNVAHFSLSQLSAMTVILPTPTSRQKYSTPIHMVQHSVGVGRLSTHRTTARALGVSHHSASAASPASTGSVHWSSAELQEEAAWGGGRGGMG